MMTAEMKKLFEAQGLVCLTDAPMNTYTSFRIGGPADLMVTPRSLAELEAALDICRSKGIKPFILGKGTNLLVADNGIRGVVIHMGEEFADISREGNSVVCMSGAPLIKLCRFAAKEGLSGLEFAYGIPGSVGGGIYMNAGAYGGELKDILSSVTYIDENGKLVSAGPDELELSYRHSVFSVRDCCIVNGTFRLRPGDSETIFTEMEEIMGRRRDKQPLEYPSAGSVFKRLPDNYASALIDKCGLKGRSVGGAQVSEKHAGFIINKGGATCADVLGLIDIVKETVLRETGYTLEREIMTV